MPVAAPAAAAGAAGDDVPTGFQWYPGVVTGIFGGTLSVTFVGAPGALATAGAVAVADPAVQLRPLVGRPACPAEAEVRPGARFMAKWAADGLWYEAVVDELVTVVAGGGGGGGGGAALRVTAARITFVGYGNSETVPREYLARLPAAAAAAAAAAAGAAAAAAAGPATGGGGAT